MGYASRNVVINLRTISRESRIKTAQSPAGKPSPIPGSEPSPGKVGLRQDKSSQASRPAKSGSEPSPGKVGLRHHYPKNEVDQDSHSEPSPGKVGLRHDPGFGVEFDHRFSEPSPGKVGLRRVLWVFQYFKFFLLRTISRESRIKTSSHSTHSPVPSGFSEPSPGKVGLRRFIDSL